MIRCGGRLVTRRAQVFSCAVVGTLHAYAPGSTRGIGLNLPSSYNLAVY